MKWCFCFFFFKQKTAYEMRISDWSSDVCSSDLRQCGTQWRHRLIEPRLCESDDIHITFDHDHAPSPSRRGGGAIEIIEGAPLVEKRRIRRVQIFGLTRAQYPPTKSNHAPSCIADRDRKSAVSGKSVSVRVDLGGRRYIKKKKKNKTRKQKK